MPNHPEILLASSSTRIAALTVLALVVVGCPSPEGDGPDVRAEAERLEAEGRDHAAELDAIAASVVAWRDRHAIEAGADEILLSLFTRRLLFHPAEPTDTTEAGRRFQEIETRVAAYRRAELALADRTVALVTRLSDRAASRPDAVHDSTIVARATVASLPFNTCPNPDGCPSPPNLPPCDLIVRGPSNNLCILREERCSSTFPPGSGGWIQICNYWCFSSTILF